MPSTVSRVASILAADPALALALPGGVHTNKTEITRQNTPEAFDEFRRILPCALVTAGPEIPIEPGGYVALSVVSIYLYHPADFEALQEQANRIYELLNKTTVAGYWYDARRVYNSPNLEDNALTCPMRETRYEMKVHRG